MDFKKRWDKIVLKWPSIKDAIMDLITWLFAAFLLPLVQLFIVKFSINPSVVNEYVYIIIFVAITSFLTGIFFFTNFWHKNRKLIRMLLMISYLISFGLFIFSLVHVMFHKVIFAQNIYEWGAIIAFTLAVIVGFCSKYDERLDLAISKRIASEAKNTTTSTIEGKEVKL